MKKQTKSLPHDPSEYWHTFAKAIVDASESCMFAVNPQRLIFLCNSKAEKKLGISPEIELGGVLPPLVEIVCNTLDSGVAQSDFTCSIQSVDFMVSVHPLTIVNELIGVICVLNEILAVEKVVRQMKFFKSMTRELDAIINSSSDGLFVCDGQGNVIRMNPASEKIHNVRQGDLVGRNMADLIEEGFIDSSAALQAGKTQQKVTLLQNKGNRKLISTGTPVFDEHNELIRVVVTERDITRIDQLQRKLEEQAFIKDQLQNQLLGMQAAELKSNKVIARSPSMLEVVERAYKVSAVDSSVLITGESGVGKGVIVKLIHNNSARAEKPLIRINCGAIPENLIESELFGYEAGAFTGARAGGKPGSLELADKGTLFLDEIAELPPAAQVKLLRFLENGRMTRLGSAKLLTVDARILAATHRDLKDMVAKGTFRHDLYYRLNVIPITIPPLRKRTDCILPLLRYYVDHYAVIVGVSKRLSRNALDALLSYSYPGNVRELMNICERIVVMSETQVIDISDLPRDVAGALTEPRVVKPGFSWGQTLTETLESVEREILCAALKKYKNQTQISRALGVSQPTIARRLKKYKIFPTNHDQTT